MPHTHTTPLSIKSLSDDGRFAGYASVFDVLDNQRDIMLAGAFTRSLAATPTHAIKLLWQHRMDEPIGTITELFEDENGLYIEGRLTLEVARAREAHALLKEGVIKGLSIGYAPKSYRTDPDTGIRALAEVDLVEVSLVTFPANEAAQVTVVKDSRSASEAQGQDNISLPPTRSAPLSWDIPPAPPLRGERRGAMRQHCEPVGGDTKNPHAPHRIALSDALCMAIAALR